MNAKMILMKRAAELVAISKRRPLTRAELAEAQVLAHVLG